MITCPFDLNNKNEVIEFSEQDPYNPQNTLDGFINRRQGQLYGALWITKVNGKPCEQLIYSAPKQHYPFDKNDNWKFPEYDYIELYEKLDGTCIISYNYKDEKGNVFLTYKTRLRPFLGVGKFGNFFALWNEMRKQYPKIDELCRSVGLNFVFELYGKRNKILIDYDEPLTTKLIFMIGNDGTIIPPNVIAFTTETTVPCLLPEKTIANINADIYNEIKEQLEKELSVDEVNKIIKGKEGYVMYFMIDGCAVQIKNKPLTVLKYHWSGDAVPFESVYTTVVNAFENFDNPTYDDVVGLLMEEFDISKIEKARTRIENTLERVTFEKKLQFEIVDIYNKLGVDINVDKKTVMRHFATLYPKNQSSRIFTLLNRYVNKKGDNMETKKESKKKCFSTIEFGDDFGDNCTTFHCQLERGHTGKHKEEGDMYGTPFTLEWDTKQENKKDKKKEK
jgi:hypothetical protein